MSPKEFTLMSYTIRGLDDLKKAIKENKNILLYKSINSVDPIHITCDIAMFAAWFGQFEIIKYLHTEYNWDFTRKNFSGHDTYYFAKNYPDIAKYIKENLPTTIENNIENDIEKIVDKHVLKLYDQLSEKDKKIKELEEHLKNIQGTLKKLIDY